MSDQWHMVKDWLDGLSFAAVIAVLFGMLPHLTAIVTLAYVIVRLYETETVGRILGRRMRRRRSDD